MISFFTKLLTPVFITLGLVNPVSVIEDPTSDVQVQQELIELRQKVQELENQEEPKIDQMLEEKSVEIKPTEIKKVTPVIDNHSVIFDKQIKAKEQAELKAKLDQEDFIAKQKLEQEYRTNSLKESVECKEATKLLEKKREERKKISKKINIEDNDNINKFEESILNSLQNTRELQRLNDEEKLLLTDYYKYCEGHFSFPSVPKIYNTTCYDSYGSVNCTTY